MAHVALYSPYIPKHSGGGEKYLLSLAEVSSRYHKTTILVPFSQVDETRGALPQYGKTFGLDLSQIEVSGSSIGHTKGPVKTMVETKRYSHLFAMTDGSIFPSLATHSHFIVQVPWTHKLSFAERIKLNTWDSVLVYSEFVKKVLEKSWNIKKLAVLSPYVDLDQFEPGQKENVILSVGRFFRHQTSNSKRQDVIIDAFKRLVDKGILTGYSLVLMGNVDPNPDSFEYLEELKQQAYGYHINFKTDASFDQLRKAYKTARFYWHAAGYGIDPEKNPENTEHFGMTTLEAMSCECIPLVVPYGGQKEIVGDSHFFWETIDKLYEKMYELTHMKVAEFKAVQQEMRVRAKAYSKPNFIQQVEKLI